MKMDNFYNAYEKNWKITNTNRKQYNTNKNLYMSIQMNTCNIEFCVLALAIQNLPET